MSFDQELCHVESEATRKLWFADDGCEANKFDDELTNLCNILPKHKVGTVQERIDFVDFSLWKFVNCIFEEKNSVEVTFSNSTFSRTLIEASDFKDSDFENCTFKNGCCFVSSRFIGCNFKDTIFEKDIFMEETGFINCSFENVSWKSINCESVYFSQDIDLIQAVNEGAYFGEGIDEVLERLGSYMYCNHIDASLSLFPEHPFRLFGYKEWI